MCTRWWAQEGKNDCPQCRSAFIETDVHDFRQPLQPILSDLRYRGPVHHHQYDLEQGVVEDESYYDLEQRSFLASSVRNNTFRFSVRNWCKIVIPSWDRVKLSLVIGTWCVILIWIMVVLYRILHIVQHMDITLAHQK